MRQYVSWLMLKLTYVLFLASSICFTTNFFLFDDSRPDLPYITFISPPQPKVEGQPAFGQPICRPEDRRLRGRIDVNISYLPWHVLNDLHPEVESGGRWRPKWCYSADHVALVVPYRDRDHHLRAFLNHMHPILQRQLLNYAIYVIEQDNSSLFNRGLLMNIGFVEALREDHFDCFVFTDVDLLPEDDRNIYGCPLQPRHLSVSVDKLGYKLLYPELFGGVENFRTKDFQAINGFSNVYFGWGGEDDDLYNRAVFKGYQLSRPSDDIGRYTMNNHTSQSQQTDRLSWLQTWKMRRSIDGLNSLQYEVVRSQREPLYHLISVKLNQTQVIKHLSTSMKEQYLLKTLRSREFM